jgi:membrane-associated protease RseP (regulator of RpoE activity)
VIDARPRPRFPARHAVLFLLTAATTWAAGGAAYAAALLGVLLVHETGHFLLARRHGVRATLPYFVPFPIGIGTLGAVIRLRSPMPTRRAVLEIGAAGPIAGFALAVPLLLWGVAHSEPIDVPAAGERIASGLDVVGWLAAGSGREMTLTQFVLGDSLVTWLAQEALVGELPPGKGLLLHPVAWAAWLGLFVTALNLVPQGQLDGGHVLYALLGARAAERISRLVSWALLLLGVFASFNWLVWWAVTRVVVGFRHPPPLLEEPLGRGRRALAVASLALFAATFVPVPISF